MTREKLLFICSRNQWRSPTAAALFNHSQHYEARSAGTEKAARVKVTPGLLSWADQIFVMEKRHRERLHQQYGDTIANKRLIVLAIPDAYTFMDAKLVELLRARLSDHLTGLD
jgi:predicted protein tyrosine phosphatase